MTYDFAGARVWPQSRPRRGKRLPGRAADGDRRRWEGEGWGGKVPNAHSTVEAIKTTVAYYSLPSCTYHVSVMTYFDNSERENVIDY